MVTHVDLLSCHVGVKGNDRADRLAGKDLWNYCPGHAGVKGYDRADRLAGKDSCGSTVLDRLVSREMTEQTDWRATTPVDLTVLDILVSREMTEQIYWRATTPVDLLSWIGWCQEK